MTTTAAGAAVIDLKKKARADRTLTRRDLWKAIHRACPTFSVEMARASVDAVFEEIVEALLRGETVKLHNFGAFRIRAKRKRIGRNPKTQDEAVITARRIVTFKGSNGMAERINGGFLRKR